MMKMRLAIAGLSGRMGQAVLRVLQDHDTAIAVSGLVRTLLSSPSFYPQKLATSLPSFRITDSLQEALLDADGIIDFTTPSTSVKIAAAAAKRGLVHVIGTTGFSSQELEALQTAAQRAVIIRSGNMSLGINLLASLVRQAAQALSKEWDIEIVEMHHRMKVDAPSGTALLLGEAAAEGRGISLEAHKTTHSSKPLASKPLASNQVGPRTPGLIGFSSLRGGTVVGDHSVIFAGPGERLELTHRAEDRSIFAQGAIHAALWGYGRAPGAYSMADVLESHEE